MARLFLLALTLVGLVLSGVSMSVHHSSTAPTADLIVASAHSSALVEHTALGPNHHKVDALLDLTTATCVGCTTGLPSHHDAVLMALGCVLAMVVVTALAKPLSTALRSRIQTLVVPVRALVRSLRHSLVDTLAAPDLLALGISRQ